MSAFLGPIHLWLYNKIQIQNKLIDEITNISEGLIPNLKEELELRYGVSETRPLEEVIDGSNIHGWLQERVSQAEYKLAYAITSLLNKDADVLHRIEEVFYLKGEEVSGMLQDADAKKAYKVISDSLLDGMPCDHANTVLEESSDKVTWRRNTCVHQDYWEEVGGDISNYYKLREAFIEGALQGTALSYERIDDVTNIIKRA